MGQEKVALLTAALPWAGTAALFWIAVEDARRMAVPWVPVGLLATAGLARLALSGGWKDAAWSCLLAAVFLLFWLLKGVGEGDVALAFALVPWFELREYALVVTAGAGLGVLWGVLRLVRTGNLRAWARTVRAGARGRIPDTSEEGLMRPDCVPFAAALAVAAAVFMLREWSCCSG